MSSSVEVLAFDSAELEFEFGLESECRLFKFAFESLGCSTFLLRFAFALDALIMKKTTAAIPARQTQWLKSRRYQESMATFGACVRRKNRENVEPGG